MMSTIVNLECRNCGRKWSDDLKNHQGREVIYRGEEKKTKTEEYRLPCPNCGAYHIKRVEVEA